MASLTGSVVIQRVVIQRLKHVPGPDIPGPDMRVQTFPTCSRRRLTAPRGPVPEAAAGARTGRAASGRSPRGARLQSCAPRALGEAIERILVASGDTARQQISGGGLTWGRGNDSQPSKFGEAMFVQLVG